MPVEAPEPAPAPAPALARGSSRTHRAAGPLESSIAVKRVAEAPISAVLVVDAHTGATHDSASVGAIAPSAVIGDRVRAARK